MSGPRQVTERDRRAGGTDRRSRFRDRRRSATHIDPRSGLGRALRWFTGPWTSANGLSWFWVVVAIFVVRAFFLQLYVVSSSSMEPTLHGDERSVWADRVAVNKVAYGLKIPGKGQYFLRLGEPKRWDIVVYEPVTATTGEKVVVKRVAGLPGEKVHVQGGALYINDRIVEPPPGITNLYYTAGLATQDLVIYNFLLDFAAQKSVAFEILNMEDDRMDTLRADIEKLHPHVRDLPLDTLTRIEKVELLANVDPDSIALVRDWWSGKLDTVGRSLYGILHRPQYSVVPEGHYFCLGDNSPESIDSRVYGWVPRENLIGRAYAVALPLGRIRDLSGFTATGSGRLALYGIPLLLLLWEVVPGFVAFSYRLRGAIETLGLERGDHVFVNRLVYGLRVPFSNRRLRWWRRPVAGDVICYLLSEPGSRTLDLYCGEVDEVLSGHAYVVRGPADTEGAKRWVSIDGASVMGRATAVWWPLRRRRRVALRQTQ